MNTKGLVCATIFVLCVVAIVFFVPISTESVRIVKLSDAPDAIQLSATEHLRQRLHLSAGTYSGVAVFSNDDLLNGRVLHAVVEDRKGDVIAQGSGVTTEYRPSANVLRIEIGVSWFTVTHDDFYIVDLSFDRGDPISLRNISRDTNLPAVHKLSINGISKPAILSLSVMRRVPTVFAVRQGVLVGAAFLLAVLLLSILKTDRSKTIAGILLIIFFTPIAVLGYWYSTGDLGIADWDYYIALHDSYRKALLTYHTFPFWNPYPCGGTAGLADPEFPMFSPTFLLELVFGVPVGIKLAISLSVAVGGVGMLMLAQRLGRSVQAGLIAALAVAFGTVNVLEITEGHVNVLAAMWIPWIFWAWLGVYRATLKPIVCGVFLALTFLAGGIYLLMYTTLAFAGLLFVVRDFRRALLTTLRSGLWALGLSAFKLVPVLYWLKQFPDDAYTSSTYTLPWLVDILFGRYIHGSYIILNQGSGWHEYGAYIGYIILALALIGVASIKKSRVVRGLCIATIIAVLLSTLGPQLQPLFNYLWFFPRSNISRFVLFAVIPLGLLASYGADRFAGFFSQSRRGIILAFLVGVVAIDIISVTYQVSDQAFILPHVVPAISPAPYPIAFTPDRFDASGEGSRTTRSVDAYAAGYGTMVYCSVLGPKPAVRTIYDEGDSSAVYPVDSRAHATLLSWNYNTVRVNVESPVDTFVVVNTNYADGWTANGKKAIVVENKVAAPVPAGTHNITFHYTAPGFLLGLGITVGVLLFSIRKKLK